MNFFDGKLSRIAAEKTRASFAGEGIEVNDIRLVSTDKKAGIQARIGIRPQHLKPDPNGQLVGKVTLVERLGTETIVELVSKKGAPFRFVSGDVSDLSIGDEARFSFDQSLAHLF